ncbi:S8 family serine peptidase [Corynebacterium alimapuense]|uniref:Peptidase S8/S53 domain-containing protein n=1 Tax=Corynebacterium alimapuense TaxID=1576874 RepID=A0A3M8K6N8_9CORY|nr:S8 family serine peptidase [Corynebacterium alimapuense]RNE48871.1 hypothetical protein C5L39_06135 [Corynebacterium alimapuense]
MKSAIAMALTVLLVVLAPPAPAFAQSPSIPCAVPIPALAPASDSELMITHRIARGEGIRVAIIDTGVAAHPNLGHVEAVADLVSPENPNPLQDCDGHGTIVAGVVTDIAPGVHILSIRQSSAHFRRADGDATGTLSGLAQALHAALDADAHVINISVVSCVAQEQASALDTGILEDALARAEALGVVVVSAAGNLSATCQETMMVYPAQSPTVLPVAAQHANDPHVLADYSMALPGQVVAPGRYSAGLSPTGEGWAEAMTNPQGQVTSFEGTSFSAPLVSGVAALLRERYPGDSAAQLRERIRQSAEPGHGAVEPHTALTHLPGQFATAPHAIDAQLPTPAEPHARRQATRLLGVVAAISLLGLVLLSFSVPGRSKWQRV